MDVGVGLPGGGCPEGGGARADGARAYDTLLRLLSSSMAQRPLGVDLDVSAPTILIPFSTSGSQCRDLSLRYASACVYVRAFVCVLSRVCVRACVRACVCVLVCACVILI